VDVIHLTIGVKKSRSAPPGRGNRIVAIAPSFVSDDGLSRQLQKAWRLEFVRREKINSEKKPICQVDRARFALDPPAFQVDISGSMGRGGKPWTSRQAEFHFADAKGTRVNVHNHKLGSGSAR
jgi:hypothetical protein